jgi:MYXO-CTERM domain-containing protein
LIPAPPVPPAPFAAAAAAQAPGVPVVPEADTLPLVAGALVALGGLWLVRGRRRDGA